MLQMTWFTYVAVAIAVLAYADGYSVGAPESACKDMIPRHPVPPQKTAPPYKITTSTKVRDFFYKDVIAILLKKTI